MRRMTPLALVLALAAPAAVLAQAGPGAGRGAMFDQLDANRDGVLSREEFMAMPARGPGPGQGRMGPGMMGGGRGPGPGSAGAGAEVPPMFGHIDRDGSGAISRDELAGFQEGVFYAMDADGDGGLTEDEFMAVRMGPGAAAAAPGRNQPARRATKQARFAELDRNGDGKVDLTEFTTGGDHAFTALDGNGDGAIDVAEFRARAR